MISSIHTFKSVDHLLKASLSISKLVMLSLLKVNLNDLGSLIGMREWPENLDVNVFSLTDLDLHKKVGSSNNL